MTLAPSRAKVKRAQRILKKDPHNRQAHLALGWRAVARGEGDRACRHLEAALAVQPADDEVQRILAGLYLHRGQVEQAERLYAAVLEAAPADPEPLCALGRIAYQRHDIERARGYLNRASLTNFDDGKLANDLGVLCQLVGELRQAEDHLKRAARLDPHYADAAFNLGVLYAETHRAAEAIEQFQRFLRLEPDNAAAHHALGTLEVDRGDYEAARSSFCAALNLAPKHKDYLYSLATTELALSNLEAAGEAFMACLALDPAFAAAKHGLTTCYARRGMIEKAVQLWPETSSDPYVAGKEHARNGAASLHPKSDLTLPAGHQIRKISVILPAYNECSHLLSNIGETSRVLNNLGCDYEIIVADDGSNDDTKAVAELLSHKLDKVHVWGNGRNQGKGMALRRASQVASGDIVVFLDADLELHPRQIVGLLETMRREQADIVVGSKRHPDSKLRYPLQRKLMSSAYALVLKLLFGMPVRDTQTGLKLFKRGVLQDVLPRLIEKKYAFDVELLAVAYRRGYRIAEAPVELNFSRARSRIGFKDVVRTALDTLGIYYRLNHLRYYDRPRLPLLVAPTVSIVIAAGRDTRYLDECLSHCTKLDYPNVEVIVLPDERYEAAQPNVRVVPTGPLAPAAKRDYGYRMAGGEIIAFLDDDAFPHPDWLKMAVRNFQRPEVAAVGGPGVTPEGDTFWQRISGNLYASHLVGGPYRYRYMPRNYQEVDDYPTCNLLIRKSVLDELGGCQCAYWPGEDTVLCARITHELQRCIIYDPDALVYHHRRELFRPHLRQIKQYALHRGHFVKRFPATSRRPAYFLPSAFTLACAGGWLAGLLHPLGWWLYGAMLTTYGVALAVSGLSTLSVSSCLVFMAGGVLSHWTYGIYFLRGLLTKNLNDAKRRPMVMTPRPALTDETADMHAA